MDHFTLINTLGGSFADQRDANALAADYIGVDERDLPQLLLALRAYAKNLHFYDLDGNSRGNWLSMLLGNDAILIADAALDNIEPLKARYHIAQSKGLRHAIADIWLVVRRLNGWLTFAQKFQSPEGIRLYTKASKTIFMNLAEPVADLLNLASAYRAIDKKTVESLLPAWNSQQLRQQQNTLERYKTRNDREQRLQSIFNTCLNVQAFLTRQCQQSLPTCLSEQSHDPTSGLLLAFLQTYQASQAKLNQFAPRLLDFYYNQLLENSPRDNGYDRVFLQAKLLNTDTPVLINKGTGFSAGTTAEHQAVLYQAEQNTLITGASVSAIKTVFLQRQPLISPENLSHSVTRIKACDFQQAIATNPDQKLNLFGFDDGYAGFSLGSEADICSVIASDILHLAEGRRRLSLTVQLTGRHQYRLFNHHKINRQCDQLKSGGGNSALLTALANSLLEAFSPLLSNKESIAELQPILINALQPLTANFWANINTESHRQQLYDLCLITLTCQCQHNGSFVMLYHQLQCLHMLDDQRFSSDQRQSIINKAIALWSDDPGREKDLSRIEAEFAESGHGLFYRYFGNAFVLRLTTSNGWFETRRYAITPLSGRSGFTLNLEIDASVDPIVDYDAKLHGGAHPGTLPRWEISINPQAKVHPYSYLEPFFVDKLRIKADVAGFKQLIIRNDHGMLDTSKPFQPFGPLPSNGSAFYVGGYEFARKSLTSLKVNLTWRQLPEVYGGFAAHYQGYDGDYSNDSFRCLISVSTAGSFLPLDEKRQQRENLFSADKGSDELRANRKMPIQIDGQLLPLDPHVDSNAYKDFTQLRNGHVRFRLVAGPQVFGHKAYPKKLAEILTHNARSRKKLDLIDEPYTPEIDSVSVDYAAEVTLNPDQQFNQDKPATTLFYYQTPLGIEQPKQQMERAHMGFLPSWQADGNLYIGFDKPLAADSVTLFFQLKNDATHAVDHSTPPPQWHYFSSTGWRQLETRDLLADSTNALKHSGIISVKLPADLARRADILPANQYWLRISSSEHLSNYSSLQNIVFDAISVSSVDNSTKITHHPDIFADGLSAKWRPLKDIDGIQTFTQQLPAINREDSESQGQATLRMYERLRHKGRALNSWDYERLVLAQFKGLHMVKSFAATSMHTTTPKPGHVLVVVVPHVSHTGQIFSRGYRVNSVTLQAIADYLQQRMPGHINLEVSNAVYETLQVRCSVSFTQRVDHGRQLEKLNADISEYLSPWSSIGCSVKFGWQIRPQDVEAYVRDLPYVANVTGFSLIKIVEVQTKPQKFHLADSAARTDASFLTQLSDETDTEDYKAATQPAAPSHAAMPPLQAEFAWSLAIPAQQHYIQVLDTELPQTQEAEPCGINNLEIGSTFVIKGNRHAIA